VTFLRYTQKGDESKREKKGEYIVDVKVLVV
jgi:hypothetical protein